MVSTVIAEEQEVGGCRLLLDQIRPAIHAHLDDPVIETFGLTIGFGNEPVLSGVDLPVARHQITAIVGPSGSGKTTFLRSLNRMNDKLRGFRRSGRVELEGQDIYVAGVDPLVVRKRVGMVFQRPNPFPMSIRDNVLAGVKVHKMVPRAALADVVETRLAEVGLWPAVAGRLSDSPYRLSGGQQQLLCLARALAVAPDVLLLDEPTSSLDPVSTEAVEALLLRLAAKVSMVIVTHNLAQARRIADQVAFFCEGRLIEAGPTEAVFESPKRRETGKYLQGQFG